MTVHSLVRRTLAASASVVVLVAALTTPTPATAVAPPRVTGVAADSGLARGGELVTLHGSGFSGAYVVSFGTTKTRSLHVWSSTEITARAPAHAAGAVYVRVARPGIASSASTLARYTYRPATAVPRDLRPTGTARSAPAVSTLTDETQEVPVDLSCASAQFCAAVGDLGLSTYDGTAWSAVTPTGSGTTRPQVSCAADFCMAATADAHRWRYQGGTWTDLGALPGISKLDCVRDVCIAEAGHLAYLYDDGAWRPGQQAVTGGVSGVACAAGGCVVTSPSRYFRVYSYTTNTWGPQQAMWDSPSLRRSSLTAGVIGELRCSSSQRCMSTGQPDTGSGVQQYALFTGRTWSIRQSHRTTLGLPDTGSTRLKECRTSSACVEVSYQTDDTGQQYRQWTPFAGTLAPPFGGVPPTGSFNSISCWSGFRCLGISYGTYQPVDNSS